MSLSSPVEMNPKPLSVSRLIVPSAIVSVLPSQGARRQVCADSNASCSIIFTGIRREVHAKKIEKCTVDADPRLNLLFLQRLFLQSCHCQQGPSPARLRPLLYLVTPLAIAVCLRRNRSPNPQSARPNQAADRLSAAEQLRFVLTHSSMVPRAMLATATANRRKEVLRPLSQRRSSKHSSSSLRCSMRIVRSCVKSSSNCAPMSSGLK